MSVTSNPPGTPHRWRKRAIYLRDLLVELVRRDIKIQFKRSSLGVFWALAHPLFQLLVFGFFFAKVLEMRVPRYSSYAFSGLMVWTWFAGSLSQGVRAMTGNRELIKRPGFPAAILPVVSVVTPGVHFLWGLPVLFVFLAMNQAPMNWSLLILPALIFVQCLLSLSLIYFLAALNVVFRDTQHILAVLLQVGIFACPIFYEARQVPERYQTFYNLNPMVHLIEAYRAVLLHGRLPEPRTLLLTTVLGGAVLFIAYKVFVAMSYRFAEEL